MNKLLLLIIFVLLMWKGISTTIEQILTERNTAKKNNGSIEKSLKLNELKIPEITYPKKPRNVFYDKALHYIPPVKPNKSKTSSSKDAPVAKPEIVLGSVLWGSRPVAILRKQSESRVLRSGDDAWGYRVFKIEKGEVVLEKGGVKFVLR